MENYRVSINLAVHSIKTQFMKKNNVVFILLVLVGFGACSKKSNPAKAEVEKKTSYNVEIVKLIQARCAPCHLPSKGGFKANFENYASAVKYADAMIKRIELNPGDKGFMPFKGEKLAEAEIVLFKKWVDGGMAE